MPDISEVGVTPTASGTNGQPYRNNKGRRGNNNHSTKESRFEGSCDDLKGIVYDVTSGNDTFLKTTRKIAEYVSREYSDAGEFRLAMIDMNLPGLVEPTPPTDMANIMQLERWKMGMRNHDKDVQSRNRNKQRIYSLVLGQCSQALCNRMEAHQNWSGTDATSDIIALLTIIQVCMTLRQTRKYKTHSLFDAEARVLAYKQGKNESNHEYYEKFKDNISTAERLGSELGAHSSRIEAILDVITADPAAPTDAELAKATVKAKDEYFSVCFIVNSCKRRYGTLVRDIENEHTRGTNSYPRTLSGAYDYLVNYKTNRTSANDQDEGGLAFYNDDDNKSGGRGYDRGRGGRGGRGGRDGERGRGRGGSGKSYYKKGGSESQGSGHDATKSSDGNDGNHAQFLLDSNADNLENDDDAYLATPTKTVVDSCFQMLTDVNYLKGNILLLDSCSTVNLISNGDLLHDIKEVEWHMRVQCNKAGLETFQSRYVQSQRSGEHSFSQFGQAPLSCHIRQRRR
jgi:hypothetical protein